MMKPYLSQKFNLFFFIALLFSFTSYSYANSDFTFTSGNQLKASINSEYGYIDNFLLSHNNEESTSYLKISPNMLMQAQFERLLLQLDAKTEHYKYQDFSEDDHSTYKVLPNLYYKFSQNKTLYLKAKSEERYESRGSGLTLGGGETISSGDKKDSTGVYGGYLYGSETSVAKLSVNLSYEREEYNTRRDETYVLDSNIKAINTSFDYLLSGKTYLAFDLGYTQNDYDNDSQRNEDELIALMGVKWEVSNLTQLDVLIGYQEITFDESSERDDSSFNWRVNLDWKPFDNTRINVISERSFQDADRLSNSYRVADSYQLKLNQNFTDYFKLTADIAFSDESVYTDNIEDSEDYLRINAKWVYVRNQWLQFYFDYKYQELSSNDLATEYEQNQFGLGLQIFL